MKQYSQNAFWNKIAEKIFSTVEFKGIERPRLEGLFIWNDEQIDKYERLKEFNYNEKWELDGFVILKCFNKNYKKSSDSEIQEFFYCTLFDGETKTKPSISNDFDTQLLISLGYKYDGYNSHFPTSASRLLKLNNGY